MPWSGILIPCPATVTSHSAHVTEEDDPMDVHVNDQADGLLSEYGGR